MPLEEYRAKRDFDASPEPSAAPSTAPHAEPPTSRSTEPRAESSGDSAGTHGGLRFVVQKHRARALHYDFRLELDGVLVSWAVPKGPSLDPADKRLAVHVEDHPLDYARFEGTIPAGEYGAGTVEIWDAGTWEPIGDPRAGLADGDLKFALLGKKLRGLWVLVRLKPRAGEKRDNWLLIKERDEFARPRTEFDVLAENSAPDSNANGGSAPDPAPFPREIDFELATLVDTPPFGDDWIAEVKYDGYRIAIALEDGHARALTRSHSDWSDRFAPLLFAATALPATSAVIDGEAVVFDERGISRFELLQRDLGEHPERVAFVAFDLLYLNGQDLRDLTLRQRKELLHELFADLPEASPLRYAEGIAGRQEEFYQQACVSDLEGIVCKKANSRSIPGRGRDWVKIKCRQSQEFVVGGFTEGSGARAELGSVLVGTYDGARLVYAGRVGSGLDAATVTSLRERLDGLAQPEAPFDPPPHITGHVVHWSRPDVVVQVRFREWTSEGLLRQPVFLGVREDKSPREVVRERAANATGGPAGVPPGAHASVASAHTASVHGVRITHPAKTLFPDSPDFAKVDLARYYEAVAPPMLADIAERPLTLVRCPAGDGRDCFYQRHPDVGMSAHVRRLPHVLKGEPVELLYVDSVEGLIALAQMGVGEIHAWMSHIRTPARPDRICFDLDPGPNVLWPQIRAAALVVRDECSAMGLATYLKSTGSKGLHVVVPIEPAFEFGRIRALAKSIVDRLVSRHPDALVGKMAKEARVGRVFFDYLRNAEGASAIAPYSTRVRPGPPCSIPLDWGELTDTFDVRSFTPDRVLTRVAEGIDPWHDIDAAAASATILEAAEASLGT